MRAQTPAFVSPIHDAAVSALTFIGDDMLVAGTEFGSIYTYDVDKDLPSAPAVRDGACIVRR